MKKDEHVYQSPEIEVIEINVEHGFAASGTPEGWNPDKEI